MLVVLTTFRDSVLAPSSKTKPSKTFSDSLTPEYETNLNPEIII